MRRRLRKKTRKGEFQELGFEVSAVLREGLSSADFDAFLDQWLDVVEVRRLASGGGGGHESATFGGFVTRMGRGSATDDDRAALHGFLERSSTVVRHEVLGLRDAWYGWDELG